MPLSLPKFLWLITKLVATLISFSAAIIAALFLYDLLTRGRWGYPWWLFPILVGTSGVAWLLRRDAAWILREMAQREDVSLERRIKPIVHAD